MSFYSEPAKLLIIITGSLIAKTIIQEVVKDLYGALKDWVKQHRKGPEKSEGLAIRIHYGILIDIRCEGTKYAGGLTFYDEETMLIALYRYQQQVTSEKEEPAAPTPRLIMREIEYPYLNMWIFGSLLLVARTKPLIVAFVWAFPSIPRNDL
jgi:hypothetical protein